MDVFFRYLFEYLISNQDPKTFTKVIINTLTKFAYLPATLISDKGSAFMSHVIKEVAGVLGFILKRATTKHTQTIDVLERSHASFKQTLKTETSERKSFWCKHVSCAVLNYNTSNHASFYCEPSRGYHGRIPYKFLDLRMGVRSEKVQTRDPQYAQDVIEQTEMIHQEVRKNAMEAYIKYKAY